MFCNGFCSNKFGMFLYCGEKTLLKVLQKPKAQKRGHKFHDGTFCKVLSVGQSQLVGQLSQLDLSLTIIQTGEKKKVTHNKNKNKNQEQKTKEKERKLQSCLVDDEGNYAKK